MIDEANLTDRERRNLAAVRIARERTRQKYGNVIQVMTTDEEAVEAAGGAAIPVNQLNNSKPLNVGWTWKGKGNEDKKMADSNSYSDLTDELIKTEERLLGKSVTVKKQTPTNVVVDNEPLEEVTEIGRVAKPTVSKSSKITKAEREKLKKLLSE